MTLLDEIRTVFTRKQIDLADLPENDPAATAARACQELFTGGVDILRSLIPNDRIRALACVMWDVIGHKRVMVAIGPDVPSLAFTVIARKGIQQGIVLIPQHWPEMVRDDGFMQLGAILSVGAQVVDFYHDRLIGDPTAALRWQAYEAEMLRTIKAHWSSWTPNDHQRQILETLPDGLDSKGVDLYQLKPFEPPRETA